MVETTCFFCGSVGDMAVAAEREQTPLGAHSIIVAGFLLGATVSQLPKESRDEVMGRVCDAHLTIMRSGIEQATALGQGNPAFEAMKPFLLRTVPPRLKQVK